MGRVILTASGKGGVGKSTLTANLAACLAKSGKRVLCIDGDLQMRNLDIVLGLTGQAVFDLQDVYLGRCDFEKACVAHPEQPNLFLLAAPAVLDEELPLLYGFVRKLTEEKRAEFDFVFVDCPSGSGDYLELLVRRGVDALIVVTPEPAALRDAERTASMIAKRGGKSRLIVNRVRKSLVNKAVLPDMDDAIDACGVRLIGIVPEDISLYIGSAEGELICSRRRTKSRKAIENIAERITGKSVPLAKF